MEMRLLQTQIDKWLPSSPLEGWRYNYPSSFKNDLAAKILCSLNNLGMGFKVNNILELGTEGLIPIQNVLHDIYRRVKDKLRK